MLKIKIGLREGDNEDEDNFDVNGAFCKPNVLWI